MAPCFLCPGDPGHSSIHGAKALGSACTPGQPVCVWVPFWGLASVEVASVCQRLCYLSWGPGGVGGTAVMLGAVAETVGTVAGEDLLLADAFMRTASPLQTVSQSNSVWLSVCQALPSCLSTRTTGTRHCRTLHSVM